MSRETGKRIAGLLDDGNLQGAAPLVHKVVLGLDKIDAPDDMDEGGPRPPPGGGRAGTQTFKRLVDQEKKTPTTEETVERRHGDIIRAAMSGGAAVRYIPISKMAPIDELLAQGRRKEAAAKLHTLILDIEKLLASDAEEPFREEGEPSPAPVAGLRGSPSETDKAGASVLYFKAMQEYAGGKLDRALSLLQSASKLEPSNQDIAKALERLAKEGP